MAKQFLPKLFKCLGHWKAYSTQAIRERKEKIGVGEVNKNFLLSMAILAKWPQSGAAQQQQQKAEAKLSCADMCVKIWLLIKHSHISLDKYITHRKLENIRYMMRVWVNEGLMTHANEICQEKWPCPTRPWCSHLKHSNKQCFQLKWKLTWNVAGHLNNKSKTFLSNLPGIMFI